MVTSSCTSGLAWDTAVLDSARKGHWVLAAAAEATVFFSTGGMVGVGSVLVTDAVAVAWEEACAACAAGAAEAGGDENGNSVSCGQ